MLPSLCWTTNSQEENNLHAVVWWYLFSCNINTVITSRALPKFRQNLSMLPCCDGLSCALDIMECIFHMVMLHNKLPSCHCAGLTLTQHTHCILTMANIKSGTVFCLLVKFAGQIQWTLQTWSISVPHDHYFIFLHLFET